MKYSVRMLLICYVVLMVALPANGYSFANELRRRGYIVFPAPQKVSLAEEDITLDGGWRVAFMEGDDDSALLRLHEGAAKLHGIEFAGGTGGRIELAVRVDAVKGPDDPALAKQAYRIEITPKLVKVTGNTGQGLFYGVQSLLQLLRGKPDGMFSLPGGTIIDWPTLELRFIHWNTQCHQKRISTMKRLIDWLAFFKVNCIGFEVMDRYEFPRHPVIGAPGAYTKAEMQELTRYALLRHIQLVPVVQTPAHMRYVLKHPEFAHLRADGNNYQACMCNEEATQLFFDMYQDMIDATPGVDLFFLSTDEVYYAGICNECEETYNIENRSQIWVDFVNRVNSWMAERDRRMLAWVEYPLLTGDILQLPASLIDAIMIPRRSKEWIENQKKAGMRSLAYSSMQGTEFLFPNYFPTRNRGRQIEGRLHEAASSVRQALNRGADLIGTFAAAWDNSGLHEECFWLGWATVTQYGWTPDGPTIEQNVSDFMDLFYGPGNPHLVEIFRLLEDGARFFEDGWDRVPSRERARGYGNSKGKGIGAERQDLTLSPPDLPSPGNLALEPSYGTRYKELIEHAVVEKRRNEHLLALLFHHLQQVERNRYSLEAFLSIAHMQRYFIKTLLALKASEELLLEASKAASENDPAKAVELMIEADREVESLLNWGDWMWKVFVEVWEKSRFPKNRSVGGRDFLFVGDDVKDYFADRRVGMEYQLAPFERMDLPGWRKQLRERIRSYAAANDVKIDRLVEDRGED